MNIKIKELVKLSEQNPGMEIFFMVENEVCAGDDFQYWRGELQKIEKEFYYTAEENIILGDAEIWDHLYLYFENDPKAENMEDEQFEKMIDNEFNRLKQNGEIKEAIIIYIGV